MSSMATRHAITALSYQHLSMELAAAWHQAHAMRTLQTAIEQFDPQQAKQMMAASMLLSICEVCCSALACSLQLFVPDLIDRL